MSAIDATDTVTVLENGVPISFSFADLIKYHGFGFPGGVAHAFKVMQRAFPLLDDGRPPERRELVLETMFAGPGARDAFEMVTRMATSGRYTVQPRPSHADPLHDWMKRYVFTWSYRGKTVEIAIRPGHVREEFLLLGAKTVRSEADEARLAELKTEMADRLMSTPAEAIYAAA
jgi:hypothetical protein